MGNFSMLPAEIMVDIFTRLPAESVLDCKSVSKTWKNVVQHLSSFSKLHFNHLDNIYSGKHSFIFLLDDKSIGVVARQFYYVEYDENSSETPSHRVKKMNLNPPFECYSLVGSSNGLICINGLPAHYSFDDSDQASYVVYICNPITRESIMLPEFRRRYYYDDPVSFFLIGFGYVSSTNEYKVVRLYKLMREPEFAQIEVYTLGSGKGWRNEGKKIYNETPGAWQHGVFANGCIYWNLGKGKIVAFDLADEMLVELSECSEFLNKNIRLGVLGDCLCATYRTNSKNSEVWLLEKEKGESLMSWRKGFSLTDMDGYDYPLALTSGGAVLCRSNTKLHLYDRISSSSKMLENFGRSFYQAVPHRNTLLFIDCIGRENTKNTGKR